MGDLRDKRNLELVGDLVGQYFPENIETFRRLQHLEQSLDEELVRRQVCLKEVQTMIENKLVPQVNQRRFRLHIFHTHENQTGADSTTWSYVPRDLSRQVMAPSWTLRIQGALTNLRGMYQKQHFSDFFDKVVITTADEVVVWDKSGQSIPCDGIELKRSTEKEMSIEITFFLDKSKTELLELPEELAKLTGSTITTIPLFYRSLCQYIRENKLTVQEDSTLFTADSFLSKYFEVPQFSQQPLSTLVARMRQRMQSAGVFTIVHQLRFDTDAVSNEQIFDVAVEAVDARALSESLPQSAEFQQLSKMISDLDKEIADKSNELKQHMIKESFLKDFAEKPLETIRALLNNPPPNPGNFKPNSTWLDYARDTKNANYFKQPWAVAAASTLLNPKP